MQARKTTIFTVLLTMQYRYTPIRTARITKAKLPRDKDVKQPGL